MSFKVGDLVEGIVAPGVNAAGQKFRGRLHRFEKILGNVEAALHSDDGAAWVIPASLRRVAQEPAPDEEIPFKVGDRVRIKQGIECCHESYWGTLATVIPMVAGKTERDVSLRMAVDGAALWFDRDELERLASPEPAPAPPLYIPSEGHLFRVVENHPNATYSTLRVGEILRAGNGCRCWPSVEPHPGWCVVKVGDGASYTISFCRVELAEKSAPAQSGSVDAAHRETAGGSASAQPVATSTQPPDPGRYTDPRTGAEYDVAAWGIVREPEPEPVAERCDCCAAPMREQTMPQSTTHDSGGSRG